MKQGDIYEFRSERVTIKWCNGKALGFSNGKYETTANAKRFLMEAKPITRTALAQTEGTNKISA